MHIVVKEKTKCTGCSACANACPKQCISMQRDDSGFIYPAIHEDSCIDCGICCNVCPTLNCQRLNTMPIDRIYAAWSKDEALRYTSTSGGAFSELAFCVLAQGGKVVGAVYDDRNLVLHEMVDDKAGLERIKQSKYLQSDIGSIFRTIKSDLETGKTVLFCGTPCQVAGLNSFLGKRYENSITIDFICRGVNSPKAYQYWLEDIEAKHSSKIRKVWFKYKKYGWKDSPRCTLVEFENGKSAILDGENNAFMKGYLDGNLFLRPSCGDCAFKGKERLSDITLADYWGVEKEKDNNGGTSMIIVNTKTGEKLLENARKSMMVFEQSFEEAFESNYCFDNSAKINERSDEFLSRLGTKPFSELLNEYVKTNIKREVKRKIRHAYQQIFGKTH